MSENVIVEREEPFSGLYSDCSIVETACDWKDVESREALDELVVKVER